MTNEKLLEILKECPEIKEKYGTYRKYTDSDSPPYIFYYNRERTVICLDMSSEDLHIIVAPEHREKGIAKDLLENFVLKNRSKNQKISLSWDGRYLKNVFLRNGYKIVKENQIYIELIKEQG